jgi:solute carrier family 25 carnitine/acylcarnitine transporter 20/29
LYNGIVDCLTKIIKTEGPLALYKGKIFINEGTVTPLIGVGILGSARFGLFENFKNMLSVRKGNGTPAPLELVDKTIAAFGAGLIVSLLVV